MSGYWPGALINPALVNPQGVTPWYNLGNVARQNGAVPPSPNQSGGLKLKAAELDAYATQLMAQAMQAKAEVLRMQTGGDATVSGAPAFTQTPVQTNSAL